jgi:signal transduction histidine kinase
MSMLTPKNLFQLGHDFIGFLHLADMQIDSLRRNMESAQPDIEKQKKAIASIERQIQLLTESTCDFMESSRLPLLNEGKQWKLTPFNFEDAINKCIEQDYAATAKALEISLETALSPLPPILGDARSIFRLVNNLIGYSFKVTPRGGMIRIEAQKEGGDIKFTVVDTSPSLAIDGLTHIFDPYYKRPNFDAPVQRPELGLALVKEIAEAHNGNVVAENAGELGIRFIVRLPTVERRREFDPSMIAEEELR